MARPNPRTFGIFSEEDFFIILEMYYRDKAEHGENTEQWILDKIDSMEAEHKDQFGYYYKKPPDQPTVASVSASTNQIINDILEHRIIAPSWFVNNNINWVITGHISEQEFLTGYYTLIDQGIIQLTTPTVPTPDSSITDNMVTQQVINFNIVNGRAVGSIKFVATNNFNPYWYGKDIVNIVKFKDPNGVNILTFVKENKLNFTETERDEVISYDEDMQGNTRATVESFVWSSATTPTPFSKMGSWDISEKEPPKPLTTGFMSAGAAGAIAGLVLLGFIIDSKVGKR